MEKESLYELGIKAQTGDEDALIKIIESKESLIKKYSFGDSDRCQFIREANKRYKKL